MRIDLLPKSAGRDQAGRLVIAGHNLHQLAEQYGTPLYLYDAATIQYQANILQSTLKRFYPAEFDVTYAAKAYFSLEMARNIAALDLGVDVVSLSELVFAKSAGFSPRQWISNSFVSPHKISEL